MSRMLFQKISKVFRALLLQKYSFQQANNRCQPKSTSSTDVEKSNKKKEEVFFPPLVFDGIKNKVALVTGGTDAIGSRCAKELLICGAKGVMIADSNEKKGYNEVFDLSREYGPEKVAFIEIQPANYMLLKNAYISTKKYFKGLDIVINNVKFKEQNWEDQIDEYVKGLVLSTQLSLEFMGKNNGGKGGTLVNVSSDYQDKTESCPIFHAVQDFIIRFDRTVGMEHFENSKVKVLTICKATLDTIGCDLARVITKGSNGCVWMP